jgi:DNA polymerase-3 subunit epsilon
VSVFVAIDFETADHKRDSACAVGICRVDCGEIVAREVRLIRPPRDGVAAMNYQVHRIPWSRLKDQPTFAEVWPTLLTFFEGAERIVAHNVSFDRSVLKACCCLARITPPDLPWVCTVELARKRWPNESNKLPDVCRRLGVPLGRHHEAAADAEMAARVLIALEGLGSEDARERLKILTALFTRAARGGRVVYGFDSRVPSCCVVTHGQVPPNFDRFAVRGDATWTRAPRGDLAELEPEELKATPTIFE